MQMRDVLVSAYAHYRDTCLSFCHTQIHFPPQCTLSLGVFQHCHWPPITTLNFARKSEVVMRQDPALSFTLLKLSLEDTEHFRDFQPVHYRNNRGP